MVTIRQQLVLSHQNGLIARRGRVKEILHPTVTEPTADQLLIVDLFAGAGGITTATLQIVEKLGLGQVGKDVRCVAVNHWATAVQTHRLNHPTVETMDSNIETLDPRDVLRRPDGTMQEIYLLVGAPPCQAFSRSAGGAPSEEREKERASIFYLLKWLWWGRPRNVIIENVPEFLESPEYRLFKRAIAALARAGLHYRMEVGKLVAADYSDPQTRERMFIQLVRVDDPERPPSITWPRPTHSNPDRPLPGTAPWRGATTLMEEDVPAFSMFEKKYAKSVRDRVARGVRDIWGDFWEPLARALENGKGAVPLSRLLKHVPEAEWPKLKVRLGTGNVVSVQPFHLGQGGGAVARRASEPLNTIATAGYARVFGLRMVVPNEGFHRGNIAYATSEPLRTITASRGAGRVADVAISLRRGGGRRSGIVVRFVDEATGEVVLEVPAERVKMHVTLRQFTVLELQRGQGFPDWYTFLGTKEDAQMQIGNAIPLGMGRALVESVLTRRGVRHTRLSDFGTSAAS